MPAIFPLHHCVPARRWRRILRWRRDFVLSLYRQARGGRGAIAAGLLVLLLGSKVSPAQEIAAPPVWRDDGTGGVIFREGKRSPRVFTLERAALESRLASAPREFAGTTVPPCEVQLPMPDGSLARFAVVESPVMAPELAAKFPEIKTYSGRGLDDPSASVRFDRTPAGVHAQILSPHGATVIDPEEPGSARHVVVSRRDLRREGAGFECLVEDTVLAFPGAGAGAAPAEEAAVAVTLRTYRLACAATGEYTQFHGGTVAAGLAAVVTAINRVNGIFESELAIRLELVGNNDAIIFTNPATDPYTGTDPAAFRGQNQTALDARIGDANYDIGHVFTTVPGGAATLGVVCLGGVKARGVSGLAAPVGDPFSVDYVAHEFGHQFGAQHTFNGVSGSCATNNRAAVAAYEPGSGSTLMAYAGICEADNLQPHSDPYFNAASINSIQAFVVVGFGADCGGRTVTTNLPPTVGAGPSHTIPRGTPFTLTASGSDPNGDALTFCWEEIDLGPAQALGSADNGSSPLFRSRPPMASPARTFPELSAILNNTPTAAEQLPTLARTMSFRVTARDNRPGGGAFAFATNQVVVAGAAGPFVITAPNAAVTWSRTGTVTWAVASTVNPPVNAAAVDILLSTNGGLTFPIVLATNRPNQGSATVNLPSLATTAARIMVRASGNIFFDISNTNFTIVPFTPTPMIVLAATALIAESCGPTNGAVDPGELVSVRVSFRNAGSGSTTQLLATLRAAGGVAWPSAPQMLGALAPEGAPGVALFTFIATNPCGGSVTATFDLIDGTNGLGSVSTTFPVGTGGPITQVFASPGVVTVPALGAATPYASTLSVGGVAHPIQHLSVTLSNVFHTAPDDLDVLLVGPGGASILLMSDAGGSTDLTGATLVFDDGAPSLLPDSTAITPGAWRPTNFGATDPFDAPAPSGSRVNTLSGFNGGAANGTWSLFIMDDASSNSGSLAAGWSLTITADRPIICCEPGPRTPPELVRLQRNVPDVAVEFASVPGLIYRVEATAALGPGAAWNGIGGGNFIVATNALTTVTDPLGANFPQRFYRVRLLP